MCDLEQRFGVAGAFAERFRESDSGVADLCRAHQKRLFIGSWALICFAAVPMLYKLLVPQTAFFWLLVASSIVALIFLMLVSGIESYAIRLLKKAEEADYHAFDVDVPNLDLLANAWHEAVLASPRPVYGFDLEIMSMLNQSAVISRARFVHKTKSRKNSAIMFANDD